MANEEHLKILKQGAEAWNKWRKQNPEIRPDLMRAALSGADVSNANLSNVDLSNADLRSANLTGANLREARLMGTNLREANLSFADLSEANLSQASLMFGNLFSAILSDANLQEAQLRGANLSSAILDGADVSGALMGLTTLANTDLSAVTGLETVIHSGPSEISIGTIYRSQGNVPEIFLREAGVPDPFIANITTLVVAMSPIDFYSCFISYGHADKAFAQKLEDELKKRGIRCWLDEHQLLPGDDIYHEVDRGIRLWDKVLLCCSESSLKSWWVDNEIRTALEKEQQLTKERGHKVHVLIPLNLDGYFFSEQWTSGYQSQLRSRLAADFTGLDNAPAKFAAQVERFVLALRSDEGAREKPPMQKL